jgi:hypothetical protein
MVRKEHRGFRVLLAHKAHRAMMDQLVHKALLAVMVCKEVRGLRE